MNSKNTELFFGDEQDVVITITDEDGTDMDVTVVAAFEIEEMGTEYVAVLEVDEDGDPVDGELFALKYSEDAHGNPVISGIEDDQEMEIVMASMQEMLDDGLFDDEEEDEEGDYLSDIKDLVPGISLEREN